MKTNTLFKTNPEFSQIIQRLQQVNYFRQLEL